jgi:hypothetical protein
VAAGALTFARPTIAFAYQWNGYSPDAKAAACQHWRDDPGGAWQTFNLSGSPLTQLSTTDYSARIRDACQ